MVEDVVDNLRAAGVDEIGLITEEPHENKTPNQAQPQRLRSQSKSATVRSGVSKKRGNELWQWQ